jgi:hypothetical protein
MQFLLPVKTLTDEVRSGQTRAACTPAIGEQAAGGSAVGYAFGAML